MLHGLLRFIYARGAFLRSEPWARVSVIGEFLAGAIAVGMLAATGIGPAAILWTALVAVIGALLVVAMMAPNEQNSIWTVLSDIEAIYSSVEIQQELRPPIH